MVSKLGLGWSWCRQGWGHWRNFIEKLNWCGIRKHWGSGYGQVEDRAIWAGRESIDVSRLLRQLWKQPLDQGQHPQHCGVLGLHCEEGRSPEHCEPEFLQGMRFSAWWGKRLTMPLGAKKGWLFESLVSNFERYTWTWDWNPSRWLHQKRQAVCLWGSPGFGQKVSNVACVARAGSTIPMVQHHLAADGLCHKGACLPWQCHWWRWEAQKMGRWRNRTSVKI